jgi:antitoxin (DNA-binding transcriptional repressor) of toxin-antitoxin stability system
MVKMNLYQATLESAVSEAQLDRVIVTENGKPVAIVIGVANMDEEQLQLSANDQFWTLISERRKQQTVSRAQLERRLEARDATRQTLTSTMTPAIAEPKADYTTNDE